ncbi:MAG: hypothetical protein H7233_02175 [Pseudorhodobacter sp.]|nr:hypothetical protein [Frankiaceae bacterium]
MTDDPLDRAVDARIEAFRPDMLPPFSAIEGRKRRRDRRRLALAGGVLPLVVAGLAFAVVPQPDGGGSERLAPDRDQRGFAAKDNPDCAYTDLSGTSCAGAGPVQRYAVHYDLAATDSDPDYREPEIKACLALPGVTEVGAFTSSPPARTVDVAGPQAEFLSCTGAIPGLKVTAVAPPVGVGNLRVDAASVTGATVCLANGSGGYPDSGCRRLDEASARRLAAALDGAERLTGGTVCTAGGPVYRILLAEPGTKPAPIVVPTPCGPMTVAGNPFRLSDRVVRAVGTEYGREDGGFPWTGAQVCVDVPEGECRRLGADDARALARALAVDSRKEVDANVIYDCVQAPRDYRMTFEHPSVRAAPITVPTVCGPMRIGDLAYEVDQATRDAVKAAFDAGSPAR